MKLAKSMTRYEELLEVAVDLFAANGYAGTSIRDIAEAGRK
jgi:AcrR family transcriptional regulator